MGINKAFTDKLLALTPEAGHFSSCIPGVTLLRADQSLPAAPILQTPTMVVLGQGMKRGYLGDEVMTYKPGQCLLVAVPMLFDCDTVVENGRPMLAVAIGVDMGITRELVSKMKPPGHSEIETSSRGMVVVDLDDSAADTVLRLINVLASPEDAKILGKSLVRELHYRMLKHPEGEVLRSIVAWQGRSGAIYRACERIRTGYAQSLNVGTLAGEAAMSKSAFHHAFRVVTGCTPIQYVKAIRLQKAHELIKPIFLCYPVGKASPGGAWGE